MTVPAWNMVANFTGNRQRATKSGGTRTVGVKATGIKVAVYPAARSLLNRPDTGPQYRYAVHWDPATDRMDDTTPIQVGDSINVETIFPGQYIEILDALYETNGLGMVVVTGFFSPIEQGQGAGG